MGLATHLLERCTFPREGTPVSCAVSGGPDSMALLVLAVEAGCRVTAVHVDHALRPGSQHEADVVADLANRLGASMRREAVRVHRGPNLEARARAARYSVLPADALLGHTADDQAETVVLNLLRGAGLEGLAGMRPDRRPLLGLRRSETRALCDERGFEVVDDPSNRDRTIRRNRVRLELFPVLDAIVERDTVPILARQAQLLRDVADELDRQAEAIDVRDAPALASAPPPLARQAVRAWLRSCSDERHPPEAATVDRVLAVARGEARATDVGAGWRVERSRQRLNLVSPSDSAASIPPD
jgi:tRNA(Ile)-lysidine synthase